MSDAGETFFVYKREMRVVAGLRFEETYEENENRHRGSDHAIVFKNLASVCVQKNVG